MSHAQAVMRAQALTSAELTTDTELLAGRRAIDAYRRELRKVNELTGLERAGKIVGALENIADGLVNVADMLYEMDEGTKDILAAANTFSTATWDVRHSLEQRLDATRAAR